MTRRRRRPRSPEPPALAASHVTRAGAAKKPYRSEGEARSAAQLAWTLDGAQLNAYRCNVCHQWHIGGAFRND